MMHFLPADQRWIVLVVILLIWLLVRGWQFLSIQKGKVNIPLGAPREYGLGGGGVCPKCHRVIRLSLADIKFGFGTRFVRCEFCGKWSLVQRLGMDELRAAEAAELALAQPAQPAREKSEAEKLADLVDQSRFSKH